MQKIVKIRNLDCAACAAELQEELEGIEGISEPSVDFMGQRVSLEYGSEEALKKALYTISHFEEVEIVGAGKRVIGIANLDCAACAAELQEELEGIEGISEPSVDFVGQRVSLEYESEEALKKALYTISHFEEVEIVDGNAPPKKEGRRKEIFSIAAALLFFIPALAIELVGGVNEWVSFALYFAAFAAAGWSVLWSVIKNFIKAFRGAPEGLLDENLLMSIAAIGAFAIRQNMEGAVVMILYQIGELLQSIAVGSSRGAIGKLMELKSDSAILLTGDTQREVPSEQLQAGDLVLVRKGDKIPADCLLLDGAAAIDAKSMTGESYYKEAAAGDELLAGCVNAGNAFKAEVLRPVSESAVAKILALVENSTAKKAKPEKFITKFARVYTPAVVLLALLVAIVPPLFQGYNFTTWIVRALNFLVISCPCALIISVPLTYFSGVGSLARCGVLAKGAVYLDALASCTAAAFDKTGTLTEGKFSVANVNGDGRALVLAASAEQSSSHPLAQAFTGITAPPAESVTDIAGMGLSAVIGGKEVLCGSLRLMRERGVACEEIASPHLVVYVAEEGRYVGAAEIEDRLRPEAEEALTRLKKTGIDTIAVLTGDTAERASGSLKGLPVDEICAQLLPEEKPQCAERLKEKGKLLYVGDGINDTPVMAASDVSVAMGALGSDAAIEAADFVLASDNLSALPKAVKSAKKTRKIVAENIVFSIAVKVALMLLSLWGLIPLWAAVLGDTGVMLLAVLNSMRMRLKIR